MKLFANVVAVIIGFVIGHYLLDGEPAVYASLLISYHLYLAFLVFTAAHEKGVSMPIGMTILTHFAFLALLVGLAYSREHIPFFGVIRWFIPSLALFETNWLFSGKGGSSFAAEEEQRYMADATLDDHEAFREYLMQSDRPFLKLGRSIPDEFNLWLADRNKKRAKAEALAAAEAAKTGGSANGSVSSIEQA